MSSKGKTVERKVISTKFTSAWCCFPFEESIIMLFFSFFKTLVGKEVAVEMKNDVVLTGTLVSVDQYLNVKLTNVTVVETDRYPQLVRCILPVHLLIFSSSHHPYHTL